MEGKELKVSERIEIVVSSAAGAGGGGGETGRGGGGAVLWSRTTATSGSTTTSTSNSSSNTRLGCLFDFEETSTTRYTSVSASYDDEVFLDSTDMLKREEDGGGGGGLLDCRREPRRRRRTSDVIDSLGETPPKEHQVFFPTDFPVSGELSSPPPTPGSDMGYYSTCGLSTPPSLLRWDFKPVWSRLSSFSLSDSGPVSAGGGPQTDRTAASDLVDSPPSAGDESDAKPLRSPSYSLPNNIESQMPVGRDSPEYNMQHPRRGAAVIFNHDTFSQGLMPDRKGSDIDVKELEATFQLLGFDVTVHHNLDFTSIQMVIQKMLCEDYSDCDCLTIAVLTHGQEPNLLYSFDYMYSVESLWQSFTPDKCPSLAGKPKMFFIQACRGKKLDPGISLVKNHTETDSGCDSYKIPKMADFLIAYSTVDGFYSWRNPENGTWFVQSLCRVLREHHEAKDLLRMLTIVSRIVAVEHESYNNVRMDQHAQKQVPTISSTLIRDIYLKPKC